MSAVLVTKEDHDFLLKYVQGIFEVLEEKTTDDPFTIEFYQTQEIQKLLKWLIPWRKRNTFLFRHLLTQQNITFNIRYTLSPLLLYLLEHRRDFPHCLYKDVHLIPLVVFQWVHDMAIVELDPIELISKACKYGNVPLVRWYCNLYSATDLRFRNKQPFRYACKYGFLELAQWLFKHYNHQSSYSVAPSVIIYGFREAFKNGHVDVVKWLEELTRREDQRVALGDFRIPSLLKKTCQRGNLNSIQWCYETKRLYEYDADFAVSWCCGFLSACENHHNDLAKWMVQQIMHDDKIFFFCNNPWNILMRICYRGNTLMAKWFLEQEQEKKNLLLTPDQIKHSIQDDVRQNPFYFYRMCLDNNSREMIEFIFELVKPYVPKHTIINGSLFLHACHTGNLDLVKWLWEQVKDEIDNQCMSQAIHYCNRRKKDHIIQWFKGELPTYPSIYPPIYPPRNNVY